MMTLDTGPSLIGSIENGVGSFIRHAFCIVLSLSKWIEMHRDDNDIRNLSRGRLYFTKSFRRKIYAKSTLRFVFQTHYDFFICVRDACDGSKLLL